LNCPLTTTTSTSTTTTTTTIYSTTATSITTTTYPGSQDACNTNCLSAGYVSGQCKGYCSIGESYMSGGCQSGWQCCCQESSTFSCSRISSNSWRCNSPTNNVVCNSISSTQWRCGIA
jgi:hypothetical protein